MLTAILDRLGNVPKAFSAGRGQSVDLFIIGVQKAGTTALANYLGRHPGIQMSAVKEIHYFNDETISWPHPKYGKLHRHFNWNAKGVIRGEATPIYTYWPGALARLKAYNPDAKLIMGLRHPSTRAFSQWRMEASRGSEKLSFEDAVSDVGRARVARMANGAHRVFSYVERGFYHSQIEALLRIFPREQVLFYKTDDLWSRTPEVVRGIEDFLGVDHAVSDSVQQEYIIPVAATDRGPMASGIRAALDALFYEDIEKTAAITGLDLSDWLRPDYVDPMR